MYFNIKHNKFYDFFITLLVYLIGIFGLFIENSTRVNCYLVFIFCFAQIFRIFFSNRKIEGQELIFLVTLIFLFVSPGFAVFYFHGLDVTDTLFFLVFFMDLIKIFSKNKYKILISKTNHFTKWKNFFIYLALLLWSAIVPFFLPQTNTFLGLFSFIVPTVIAFVYLEENLRQSNSIFFAVLLLILYFFSFSIYLMHHWSGHGRIVLAMWILAPILIYISIFKKPVKVIYIITLFPLIMYVLQYSRYTSSLGFEDVFIGSSGYHLQLTQLTRTNDYLFYEKGLEAFFDQYKLFFFAWIPNDWWVSKPQQVSVYSTAIMFSKEEVPGWGLEFSQSLGFLGEQFFLLKNYYFYGIVATLLTIIIARKFVVKLSFGSIVPAIVFDLCLINYFWGGMGIFGSRAWFYIMPIIIFLFLRFIIKMINVRNF
jgi:hypothetical protein